MGAVNLARTGAPAQTDYNGFVRNNHEITQKHPHKTLLTTTKQNTIRVYYSSLT
jgi:hypothetical protein